MFRFLTVGFLLFLVFDFPATFAASSQGQIHGVAISPDGKIVAVVFRKDGTSFIYKLPLDTAIATRLTNMTNGEESSPAFSVDGNRIVFTYKPAGALHSGIVLANVDGSAMQKWSPEGVTAFYPVLSPDNKTIVFAQSGFYGSYSPIAQPHHHAWRFYASNLDGTNLRELTTELFYAATAPSLSPDGKNMAVMTIGLDTPQQIGIYSLDRPGKPIFSLRPHVPREADHKEPIVDCPNYMPDGKSILFMAASNGKGLRQGFNYDVYRVEIGTDDVEQLTKDNGYATDLKVSADGKTAVFLKWRSDWRGTPVKSQLYVLDVEKRKLRALIVTGLN